MDTRTVIEKLPDVVREIVSDYLRDNFDHYSKLIDEIEVKLKRLQKLESYIEISKELKGLIGKGD